MLSISKQQVFERWDVLPEILREALFSEENFNFVEKACQDNHIPEDKISLVATAVGDVIFGFIHPEDLAKEIKESAGINILIAEAISKEAFKKVFLPIKESIDKVYFPVAPIKPEGVVDLRPQEKPFDGTQGKPTVISSETIEIIPKETLKQVLETQKPEIKMEIIKEQPVVFPKIEVDKSSMKLEKPLGEEEAPMMLHKETELTPLAAEKKSLAEAFTFSSGKEPEVKRESASLTAKISFGPEAEKEKKDKIQMDKPAVRVVHYSDLSTPALTFGKSAQPIKEKEIKISIPAVESGSLKINDGEKLAEKIIPLKPIEPSKPSEPLKVIDIPINELELKDIPVEEDVIDLRKIIE